MQQLPLAVRLRERAVFDSYVAGPNAAIVQQLRTLAGGTTAGVYWLSGPAGVGKTHLLQASCALARAAGLEAAYLPLPQLMAMGPETLEGWQAARVVALDDLAVIAGRRDWEQGLFRLHREVEERGALLLAAAVAPPLLLRFSLPDLGSRFAAATLLPLRALDESEQREALRLRAQLRGLELPEETALYLQRRFRRDLSTLYALLETLDAAALQAQRRLTLPFIRQVLAGLSPPPAE
ncbi:MAG TPA: DnaA regulatory inactivator Hda [Steroidobacteraceae bacterium]